MKKLRWAVLVVAAMLSGRTAPRTKAEALMRRADKTDWATDAAAGEEALRLCDRAISLCPDWWQPYHFKIQIYRRTEDFAKIADIYQEWVSRGNALDDWQKFSYGCTFYALGNSGAAAPLLESVWADFTRQAAQRELRPDDAQMMAGVFAGFVLGRMDAAVMERDYAAAIPKGGEAHTFLIELFREYGETGGSPASGRTEFAHDFAGC